MVTPITNLAEDVDAKSALSGYQKVLETFDKFNLKKDMYTALFLGIRDGIYVGYVYENKQGRTFMMPLDV
jgi:hypothetical protein